MALPNIEECEKAYLTAAERLDVLARQQAEAWLLFRQRARSDQQATQMMYAETSLSIMNQVKSELHITKLRLEAAYAKGQERKYLCCEEVK